MRDLPDGVCTPSQIRDGGEQRDRGGVGGLGGGVDIKGSGGASVSQSVESLGEVRKQPDSQHQDSQQHDSQHHDSQHQDSQHHDSQQHDSHQPAAADSQQEPDRKMVKSSQSRRLRLVQYSRRLHSRLRGLRVVRRAEGGVFNWPGGLRVARRAEGGVYNCKAVEKHFLSSCGKSSSLGHTSYPRTDTLTHSVNGGAGHTSYPRRPTVGGSCSHLVFTLQEEV